MKAKWFFNFYLVVFAVKDWGGSQSIRGIWVSSSNTETCFFTEHMKNVLELLQYTYHWIRPLSYTNWMQPLRTNVHWSNKNSGQLHSLMHDRPWLYVRKNQMRKNMSSRRAGQWCLKDSIHISSANNQVICDLDFVNRQFLSCHDFLLWWISLEVLRSSLKAIPQKHGAEKSC